MRSFVSVMPQLGILEERMQNSEVGVFELE